MALIDRGRVMIDYLEILGTMDSYKAKYEALSKAVDEAPAVDAAPVVRCKECIYWMDRHVLLNDGTRRPFKPGEDDVTCDVGINCGARCMFDADYMDGNGPFRQKEDFCSRGVKKDEGVENDG